VSVVRGSKMNTRVATQLTRSLTNPFESDPVMRTGTTCDVTQKRMENNKVEMGDDSRSLSQPTLDEPFPRCPSSANVLIKRELASKKETTIISKIKSSNTSVKKKDTISKPKKKSKKCSYKTTFEWTPLNDLEYFKYYMTTPPTPIKTKHGKTLYEVDRVLGKIKCACGTTNYLVKWRGYPNRDNSCIKVLPVDFREEWK
jgi:hypothetical protein